MEEKLYRLNRNLGGTEPLRLKGKLVLRKTSSLGSLMVVFPNVRLPNNWRVEFFAEEDALGEVTGVYARDVHKVQRTKVGPQEMPNLYEVSGI